MTGKNFLSSKSENAMASKGTGAIHRSSWHFLLRHFIAFPRCISPLQHFFDRLKSKDCSFCLRDCFCCVFPGFQRNFYGTARDCFQSRGRRNCTILPNPSACKDSVVRSYPASLIVAEDLFPCLKALYVTAGQGDKRMLSLTESLVDCSIVLSQIELMITLRN